MFGKALAGILGFCFLMFVGMGIVVYQSGILIVNVHDKAEGRHIFVPVPMLLADFGLNFVPNDARMRIHDRIGSHSKMVAAMAEQLSQCPDGTFVEVESGRDHVVVKKSGGDLVVEVNSEDEEVYLQLPLKPVGRIVEKI
jgi:hypothetical protein